MAVPPPSTRCRPPRAPCSSTPTRRIYAFDLLGSTGTGWILNRSAARIAERPDTELPAFDGLPGWNPSWALPKSVSGGASVIVVRGAAPEAVFQPSARAGMDLIIVKR